MDSIVRAMIELDQSHMFVNLAFRGLSFAAVSREARDWLAKYGDLVDEEKTISSKLDEYHSQQTLKLEEFAEEQISQGFPYLFKIMTTHLWSVVEFLVNEIVTERLKDSTTWSNPEKLYSIKGSIVEFSNLSKDDQANYLTFELQRLSNSSSKLGVGQFESLLDIVGCGGSVPDEVRRVLLELQQLRHVSAHRMGIVDRKLLDVCPWITNGIATPIQLSMSHYQVYSAAATWYVMEIAVRTANQKRKKYIQASVDVQNESLNSLHTEGLSRWS